MGAARGFQTGPGGGARGSGGGTGAGRVGPGRAGTMRAAQPPAARRSGRAPLRELRLQPGTERTCLTPLLRRLRLKDHDGNSPGPCTPGPPGSTPLRPCTPGPCTPGPPSSTTPGPCTPEPPGSVRALEPPLGSATPGPCSLEPPSSATLQPAGSTTPEPPGTATPGPCSLEPPESIAPEPSTAEHAGNATLEPPGSSMPGPCTPEHPGNATLEPPGSSMPGPCTPEHPGNATLEPPSSTPLGPCNLEPPSSTPSGPCTPRPPGSTPLGSPGSPTPVPCTPGPPGTSSTPQGEAPFRGWRAAPGDLSCSPTAPANLSCSPVAPEHPGSDGGAGPSPRAPASPTPSPPEQDPPGPSLAEAGGSEPAGPEPAATPTPSPELAPGAVSWVMPLVWLEKSLNASALPESLRHSLPPPVPRRDAGTSVTPAPAVHAGTAMTPRDPLEQSTGTSAGGAARAKDSAAETDSLLWHCPREQLRSLPRAELEGRLESTLIIIEALSLQLRDWQESQRPLPGVGPAAQRDALTQTAVTHPAGEQEIYHSLYVELRRKTEALQRQRAVEQDLKRELERATEGTSAWAEQCLLFRGLVDAAFRSLQEDREALARERDQLRSVASRCGALLQSVPGKLQGCLAERDAMRQRADEALRAKEEGDRFLEAFRSHASAQISTREQSLASQRELGALLAETIDRQALLAAEAQPFREFVDGALENLREERRALDEERDQVRSLVSRCKALLQSVPGKLQGCLEERDAMRQRADEALQAKEEASRQLEETLVALQDSVAQLEQLTVANSRLSADLSSQMKELAGAQQERDALQQENEDYREETAWLARERDALQQERDGLCQELREMTECREFIDQENRMSRTQLMEAEAKLKSALAVLRERSLQHEELKDSHQCLQEEQAALCKELESAKAELLDLQLKRAKLSQCSADVAESKARLQELADCLRAALQEEDEGAPSRSRAWTPAPRTPGWRTPGWQTPRGAWTPACRTPACRTPYRPGDSFVGSVLKAASGKDAEEATGGGSAFTRVEPASTPKRAEPEDGLLESVRELRAAVSDLAALSSRVQELEQSEFEALQTEISNLQLRLEMVTAESQEKTDAQAATIAKLNKALRGKLQNEKELQDVVKQQEEKMLQLIDKSGEVTRLKGEVSQLKRSLQRAETEAKVLWEELRGQEPKVDAVCVQERVLLRQEVDKLRLLLLEKEDESSLLSNKYLEQIRALELRLCHAQKGLRSHEELQEKMREVLSSIPDVAAGCQELHSLLRYLGLKPASGSRDAADPL
ncbi:sperm-associated antigen 5 [Dromaius novaehollandiae]